MLSTKGFHCNSNADLTSAIWTLPTGEDVLVCQKPFGGGYLLYQKAEWNDNTEPTWEADSDGRVLRKDQYVGYHNPAWIIPRVVRDRAISQ